MQQQTIVSKASCQPASSLNTAAMLPQVFELFDQLCMLSGGRCVFFGPADQALAHYEAAGVPCPPLRNPADHFLHAINPDFIVSDSERLSGWCHAGSCT